MDPSLTDETHEGQRTVSGTGLRGGNVEDEVDGCSTVLIGRLADNKERHEGSQNVVGNSSETGRRGGQVEEEVECCIIALK